MSNKHIFFTFSITFSIISAQPTFTEHAISTDADYAMFVYAADVDGDGDIDILSASRDDAKIAWYENDGSENFTEHAISTSASGAHSVYAADVDGDGDMDVLSASRNDNKISWYENDGSESFAEHVISTSADQVRSVYAADVDADGDMDVLSASQNDDKIAWYENDGGESFTEHVISTSADGAASVYAEDVDNDGDLDILSASILDGKVAWYENNGSENFTQHEITTNFNRAVCVYAADVDADGDMDVLSASYNLNTIVWYENDGNENFTTHVITNTATGAHSVFAADVDADGDMDVLSASYNNDKIDWYENDGSENFTDNTISTSANSARSVYAVDVDGDGDMDVLSASSDDDKIAWYEQDGSPFKPQTKEELQTAVDLWVDDNATALTTYGEINTWNVSLITHMSGLFEWKSAFNDDIGNWDVSSVTNMANMFYEATSFNQDLSSWDVSSVTSMGGMFRSAGIFNQDLSSWDVSSVTNMNLMFYSASSFNGDLSSWDVSSVTAMRQMFFAASSFNGDLSSWDVSSVTDMGYMFKSASSFNGDLSGWDVSNVTNMQYLFFQATIFNVDISSWDVSSVTNMTGMFDNANALSDGNKCAIHFSFQSNDAWPYDWSDLCYQFETRDELVTAVNLWISDNATALSTYGPINGWDVSLITNMGNLFYFKDFNDDISAWDVSSVTNMGFMFHNCPFNQDISGWDVSSVNSMHRMFYNSAFDQDISGWDVSNVGVNGGFGFHEFGGSFSDANRCAIHSSFSQQNVNWDYNWSGYCAIEGYTYVPDDNFEQALIDLGYDDVLDNYVVTDSISGVTSLNVYSKSISDLTGIESFVALNELACGTNPLGEVDLSNNTALTSLSIGLSQLTSLDVSSNTALTYLDCHLNEITSLDVSANTAITSISCRNNNLTELDLSNNTALTQLWCYSNQLTSLNVSANTALTTLNCQANQLTSLDVSANTALTSLSLSANNLTSLNVSANTALTTLYCENNQLTSLDVSNNTALTTLFCYYNQFTSLNMRNGVTDQLTTFNATNNPDLTCIETLDPTYATENWTSIDEGVTFSVICGTEEQDTLWHVATTGSDASGDGSYDNPFATIQTGINAAYDGNRVLVDAGTYVENISYSGKSISITGEDRETTIVDADSSSRPFTFDGESQHTLELSGFTFTNGISGGIYIIGSEIDLFDLNVTENIGRGIYIKNSVGELFHVDILDNTTPNGPVASGGGIYAGNSHLILDYVNVLNNYVPTSGGGAAFGSDQFGTSTTEWHNSVISGNSCLFSGGAISFGDSVILSNVTITQNSILWNNDDGQAIKGSGNLTIVNSIIRENMGSTNDDNEIELETGTLNISYTNLSGAESSINLGSEGVLNWGEGNIDLDPIFCDPESGDFHLAENSPCAFSGEDGSNNMGAMDIGCDAIWVPPVLSAIADTSMDEDSELGLILSAYSQDGYEIYFEVQSDSSSVYTYVDQDTLTISLMEEWSGASEITVVAYSEHGYDINDSTSFTLTVNPVDDLPYVDGHIFPLSYDEDFGTDTVAYLPDVFVDVDGELEFSYSFSETGVLSADVSGGYLVLSSVANAYGQTELFVTASNPLRASVTDTVLVEVYSVNDAPFVSFREQEMYEDSVLFVTPLADFIGDPDYDDLFLSVAHISEPMDQFVDAHFHGPDSLHIIAHGNWNGSGQIEVSVSDGQEEVTGSLELVVFPVNDDPMFHQMDALVGVGMGFVIPLHVSDIDMDTLTVSFDDHTEYPGWISLEANPFRLVGMAPEPTDIHFPLELTDGVVTVTDTFHLTAQFFNPRITAIEDIANDQGGRVYVSFMRSFFDQPNESSQMYTVFRRDVMGGGIPPEWVVVGSGSAIGDESYTYEIATLMDSTADHDGLTSFKVVASMNEGNFHSPPGNGYSVDNIAPAVPAGFMMVINEEGPEFMWESVPDEDFQYYEIDKAADSLFMTDQYSSFTTIELSLVDTQYEIGQTVYYRISAIDHAGNRGEYSQTLEVTTSLNVNGTGLVPEIYALHQNYPNPFNPTTQIRYDLPENSFVSIAIYDVMGRKIKSLVNINQNAGYRSIHWNATNDLGQPVSAGMYIYTIQAGQFRQTRKMVLLK